MKKAFAVFLLAVNMLCLCSSVMAEDNILSLNFETADDFNAMCDASSGWTVYGNRPDGSSSLTVGSGHLRIGHIWGSKTSGFYKSLDSIGMRYDYSINISFSKVDGCGALDPEYLTDGNRYTARTKITNGYYILDFSIEKDGIYGTDSTNEWKKLFDGEMLEQGVYNTFRAEVLGDSASVYKNDEFLFKFYMPESADGAKYSFEAAGEYGKAAAAPYLKGVSVTEYPVEYKFVGLTSDKTEYTDIIPPNAESAELLFNLPINDGAVNAVLYEGENAVEAETVIFKKYLIIKPTDGFKYNTGYKISITSSEEIQDLPDEIEFKTAADLFTAENCVFGENSCEVTVGNYSGSKASVCVGAFVYSDNMLKSWTYKAYELEAGEVRVLSSGAAELGDDEVSVMIFDDISNIRPYTKAFYRGGDGV